MSLFISSFNQHIIYFLTNRLIVLLSQGQKQIESKFLSEIKINLFLTYSSFYGYLKVLHFCLVRNYGLWVCGLIFMSLDARLLFC